MTFASYWKEKLKESGLWSNYGSVPPVWIVKIGSKRTNTQYGIGIQSINKEYTSDHASKVLMKKQFGEFMLYERTQDKLDALEADLEHIIDVSLDPTMLVDADVIEDFNRPAQFQLLITAERLI